MNKRYDEMLDPCSVCSSGGGGGFLTKNAKIDQATSMKMPVEMRDRGSNSSCVLFAMQAVLWHKKVALVGIGKRNGFL